MQLDESAQAVSENGQSGYKDAAVSVIYGTHGGFFPYFIHCYSPRLPLQAEKALRLLSSASSRISKLAATARESDFSQQSLPELFDNTSNSLSRLIESARGSLQVGFFFLAIGRWH